VENGEEPELKEEGLPDSTAQDYILTRYRWLLIGVLSLCTLALGGFLMRPIRPIDLDQAEVISLATQVKGMTLLQFNPHWECFSPVNLQSCGNQAFGVISGLLQRHQVDFANIVELPTSYQPPKGWAMSCRPGGGGDTTCLIWKADTWEVIGPGTECWFGRGRACAVMTFQHLGTDLKVTVAGAHFPHGAETGWYSEFLGVLHFNLDKSRNVTDKVVVLADSNAGIHQKSDISLQAGMGTLRPHVKAPTVFYKYRTCCNNVGYRGFFDRILANFGSSLALIEDGPYQGQSGGYTMTPAFARISLPSGAAAGEFHHPVLARLNL